MTLTEKSAYLKGLMDGLNINRDEDEGKLLSAVVELLHDMTSAISNLEKNAIAVSDELDEIEEDLDAIEDFLMDDEDEDEDDEDSFAFTDDDGEDFEYDEDNMYEVTCPKCGEVTTVDEETLLNDSIDCPKCGELLEFEFDEEDDL